MARGLLTGAVFFLCVSLVMIIMILWPDSPWSTWLMEKTELGDDFCWFGEGIWRTNLVWGDSSRELRCGRHGMRESDALDLYCSGSPTRNALMFDSPSYMCSVTKWGRFSMALGAALSFIGVILVVAVHFTTSLQTRKLRLKRATIVLLASFASHTALFLLMSTSPMFDTYHFSFLGKDNRVNYKGLGCVFQSPFVGGIISLVSSSPLKCLYPGPAMPLTIGIVIFQFMTCLMLILFYVDTKRRIALGVRRHEQQQQGRPRSIDEPLLLDYSGLEEDDASSTTSSRSRTCCEYLFGTGHQDYHYSLHGAFIRRLSKFHRLERNAAAILVPAVVMGSGMLLVSWFYHGMQFLVHVRAYNERYFDDDVTHNNGNQNVSMTATSIPDIPEITFVELREQVFTFDPVTSLRDFWKSKGYLLTIITAFWLDFFPFLKIFIWHFYWFVPQSEVIRGRVLTWIDYLGKWSLANLFTLCIISVAFLFKSSIHLPIPLPLRQAIMLDLECIVESGAGVTWFIFSLLWTIGLGDVFLQFHTLAREWEEQRRSSARVNTNPTENDPSSIPLPSHSDSVSSLVFEHGHVPSFLRTAAAFEDDSPVSSPQQTQRSATTMTTSAPATLETIDEQNVSVLPTTNNNGNLLNLRQSPYTPSPSQQQQPVSRSLFREILRRSSGVYVATSSNPNGPRERKQALEEYFFTPIKGQRHRFSPKGRVVIWIALVISISLLVVSFTLPVIHFTKIGAVPDLLIEKQEAEYSVLRFLPAIANNGASARPAYELAFGFALFGVVFPIIHGISLFFLWGYPMTVSQQLQLFRFMEFCDAWNAMDVFFVGCFVTWVGLESISRSVVEIVVPGLTAASRTFLGKSDVMVIIPELQYGFWWVGIALLGQKMVSHVLMELTASTIAQRQYALQQAAQQVPSATSAEDGSGGQRRRLSQDQLLMFSPAARYVGVSGVDSTVFYAGLPMWLWRLGVGIRLMDVSED